MALIVHKYGGTSMGSTERIRSVAQRVAKWVRAGHQIVVVPSAMSGETNRLLGLAKALLPEAAMASTPEALRELDAIAATGEQVSVGLLALALQAQGLQAVSYGGWQVPIATDMAYTKDNDMIPIGRSHSFLPCIAPLAAVKKQTDEISSTAPDDEDG